MKRKDDIIDTILLVLDIVVGIAIIVVVTILSLSIASRRGRHDFTYRYDEHFSECVEKGNQSYIDFYNSHYLGQSNIVSPLAIQYAVYDYNSSKNKEDKYVFSSFRNGYHNWKSSEKLFRDSSLYAFTTGFSETIPSGSYYFSNYIKELTSVEEEIDISSESLQYKNIVGLSYIDIDYDFDIKKLQDMMFLYYVKHGFVDCKKVKGVDVFRLPAGDYYIYLADASKGTDLDISYLEDNFNKEEAILLLPNKNFINSGLAYDFIKDTSLCDYKNLYSVCYLDLEKEGDIIEIDSKKDEKYLNILSNATNLSQNFKFIITSRKTGQIIMLGNVS